MGNLIGEKVAIGTGNWVQSEAGPQGYWAETGSRNGNWNLYWRLSGLKSGNWDLHWWPWDLHWRLSGLKSGNWGFTLVALTNTDLRSGPAGASAGLAPACAISSSTHKWLRRSGAKVAEVGSHSANLGQLGRLRGNPAEAGACAAPTQVARQRRRSPSLSRRAGRGVRRALLVLGGTRVPHPRGELRPAHRTPGQGGFSKENPAFFPSHAHCPSSAMNIIRTSTLSGGARPEVPVLRGGVGRFGEKPPCPGVR